MASRQAFLKREPGLARPKPNPVSRPTPATRRPPTRDPRVTPWRPRPKPIPNPKPGGPLFPGVPKPKYPVFGKRPPHLPVSPLALGRLRPLRPFLRLHPALALGFLAWDVYDLYQVLKKQYQLIGYRIDPSRNCEIPAWDSYLHFSQFGRPCNSLVNVPSPEVDWPTRQPSRIYEWWRESLTNRYGVRKSWVRTFEPGVVPGYVPPQEAIYPPPLPEEMPYPYPFAPQPLPLSPPITRPRDEPYEQPRPQPRPNPAASPVPYRPPWSTEIPVISFEPGRQPLPDIHTRRPPSDTEVEKKKRLSPGVSAAWLGFLGNAVSSYTEVDDAVEALYKGLPWYVRRWKGRDGVWRDRDITSVARAARLGQHIGKLIIEDAVTNLIVNGLTDEAFGLVGNALKQKTKELGNEGLWQGFQGPQAGGSLRGDSWEEVYEKLKKEAAQREIKRRQYTVKTRLGPGLYKYETRTRPVTQIPWFRQESLYPRMARPGMAEWWTLTAAEKAARKKNVKAWYYAPNRRPRP